ncbi:MAG: hypothetical protein ROR55_22290 [Devosia sp.]
MKVKGRRRFTGDIEDRQIAGRHVGVNHVPRQPSKACAAAQQAEAALKMAEAETSAYGLGRAVHGVIANDDFWHVGKLGRVDPPPLRQRMIAPHNADKRHRQQELGRDGARRVGGDGKAHIPTGKQPMNVGPAGFMNAQGEIAIALCEISQRTEQKIARKGDVHRNWHLAATFIALRTRQLAEPFGRFRFRDDPSRVREQQFTHLCDGHFAAVDIKQRLLQRTLHLSNGVTDRRWCFPERDGCPLEIAKLSRCNERSPLL